MIRTKKVLSLIITACAVYGFGALAVHQAHALTISPARIEVEADKGNTVTGEFTVTNDQKEQKTFYTSAENFEAKGDSGTPNFVTSSEGLASWVQVEKEVVLAAGEQKTIPYKIVIPNDVTPGGYFSAIFLNTTPPSTKAGEVAVGAKVGVLVFLRVSGDIKESGGIVGYSTANGKSFFTNVPVGFVYRFNNTGGDRVQPKGYITIKHLFGWESAKINANSEEGNILPNSTRKYESVWNPSKDAAPQGFFSTVWYQIKHFAFGRYTATIDIAYGAKDTTASKSINFWIVPWQLLVLVFLILFIGITVIRLVIKKWDKYIISQAQHAIEEQNSHHV